MVRLIWAISRMCLALIAVAGDTAHAEYRLSAGDKVELTAIGVPDLKQRLTIGIDGEISISLIGLVQAGGLTIAQLQEKIQHLATQKTFRLKGSGTNEYMVFDQHDVTISIAEYRPVFVSGDVGKPGSQPFNPGLTSRQAISMAGGCDLTRFGVLNPVMTSADVRSEYERAWIDFTTESLRMRRLTAEFDGKGLVSLDNAGEIPLPSALLQDLLRVENEKLVVRTKNLKDQKNFFEEQRDVLARRRATLEQQRGLEESGLKLDEDESARIAAQAKTGLSAVNRVADARRVSLISATRALQIGVAAANALREQEQAVRDGNALLAKYREDLLTELNDAKSKVQAAQVRIQAASDKLVYTGLLRSEISRGYGDPELKLFRKSDEKTVQLTPDLDTELTPGDALQVRCPFNLDVKLPSGG